MPTFNQAEYEALSRDPSVANPIFDHDRAYLMTSTTGNAVDAIADGFDIDDMTSAPDILNHGYQTGLGNGSRDYWRAGDTREARVLRVNDSGRLYLTSEEKRHTAKSTLSPDYGGVMTMTQWLGDAEPRPRENFWVLDTEDPGDWFYWASPLPAREATSLLLDGITIHEQRQDWEYVMTAVAEFATAQDVRNMPDLSDDAKDLWGLDRDTPDLEIPGIGETFTENDIKWRVIAEYGDYTLIMTEHVHLMGTRFLSENLNPTVIFEEAEIRSALNTWFDTYAAPEGSKLREIVMDYAFTNGARTEQGAGRENGGIPNVSLNTADAQWKCTAADAFTTCDQSHAIARPALGTEGNGEVFIPTLTEINTFVGTTNANRVATRPEGDPAQYWLRSPGQATNGTLRLIFMGGAVGGNGNGGTTFANRGSRPVLWVSR